MEEEQKKELAKSTWKKLPIKYKLIIIGIILGLSSLIIFLVVLITPLMSLGIIDIAEGTERGDYIAYNDIISSSSYYWPIGSVETISAGNGILFAKGTPESTEITSPFGYRGDIGLAGASTYHQAIDIGNYRGTGVTNIIAAQDGTVTYINTGCIEGDTKCGGNLGNYVVITHDDGIVTRYGHMYSVKVSNEAEVKQGQVIGLMGTTGNSTGVHLDFQVKVNGTPVDPLNYVSLDNPRPSNENTDEIEE